jgi:hypothetical protein
LIGQTGIPEIPPQIWSPAAVKKIRK